MAEEQNTQQAYDPLDMNNYRIEKLPKMQKSGFEKILQRIGAPLAITQGRSTHRGAAGTTQ